MVALIINLLLTPFVMLFEGWALSKVWLWFIVPQFGLRPITIPYALGLNLLITMFVHRVDLKSEKEQFPAAFLMQSLACNAVLLLIGWVIHSWWR
jgi:hypothetical protein